LCRYYSSKARRNVGEWRGSGWRRGWRGAGWRGQRGEYNGTEP